MKKVLATLMVLALAMPALAADVDFVVTDNGGGSVTISYTSTTAPRGIALAITTDGTIGDATGENGDVTSADAAYNCYMDFASTDPGAYALGAGHPLANSSQAGEPDWSQPVSAFSVCMGALDQGGNQAPGPAASADLVTLQLANATTITVAEDTFRGAVVGDAALTTNLPITIGLVGGGNCSTGDAAFQTEWAAVGSPDGWCIEVNPTQCHGNADGLGETKNNYGVFTGDLTCLLAAWGKDYATIAGQNDINGVPLINADFDKTAETKNAYRVFTGDLTILLNNWGVAAGPAADCTQVLGSQEP